MSIQSKSKKGSKERWTIQADTDTMDVFLSFRHDDRKVLTIKPEDLHENTTLKYIIANYDMEDDDDAEPTLQDFSSILFPPLYKYDGEYRTRCWGLFIDLDAMKRISFNFIPNSKHIATNSSKFVAKPKKSKSKVESEFVLKRTDWLTKMRKEAYVPSEMIEFAPGEFTRYEYVHAPNITMLAKELVDSKTGMLNRKWYPKIVGLQSKYDGNRITLSLQAYGDRTKIKCLSRGGIPYAGLDYMYDEVTVLLNALEDANENFWFADGEVYKHGMEHKELQSLVRRTKSASDAEAEGVYIKIY